MKEEIKKVYSIEEVEKCLEGYRNFIILIGISGSGKDTLIRNLKRKKIRICLDDIVKMATDYVLEKDIEDFYRKSEDALVKNALEVIASSDLPYDIVISRTNLTREIRKKFIDLAKIYDDFRIVGIFFNIPLEVAIKRRLQDPLLKERETRKSYDWEEIIRNQSKMLEKPSYDEGFNLILEVDENFKIA